FLNSIGSDDMLRREAIYRFHRSEFCVRYGDLTKVIADALVSSDDNYLSMGGGVSLALQQAAGPSFRENARKLVPLKLGDVVVTDAGRLRAKHVFHAVTINYDTGEYVDDKVVARATQRCLEVADAMKIKSIAFPALGTGVARFPFERAA